MDLNKLSNQQNICFILPTYNEEGTIESIITQIKAEEKKQNVLKKKFIYQKKYLVFLNHNISFYLY